MAIYGTLKNISGSPLLLPEWSIKLADQEVVDIDTDAWDNATLVRSQPTLEALLLSVDIEITQNGTAITLGGVKDWLDVNIHTPPGNGGGSGNGLIKYSSYIKFNGSKHLKFFEHPRELSHTDIGLYIPYPATMTLSDLILDEYSYEDDDDDDDDDDDEGYGGVGDTNQYEWALYTTPTTNPVVVQGSEVSFSPVDGRVIVTQHTLTLPVGEYGVGLKRTQKNTGQHFKHMVANFWITMP